MFFYTLVQHEVQYQCSTNKNRTEKGRPEKEEKNKDKTRVRHKKYIPPEKPPISHRHAALPLENMYT